MSTHAEYEEIHANARASSVTSRVDVANHFSNTLAVLTIVCAHIALSSKSFNAALERKSAPNTYTFPIRESVSHRLARFTMVAFETAPETKTFSMTLRNAPPPNKLLRETVYSSPTSITSHASNNAHAASNPSFSMTPYAYAYAYCAAAAGVSNANSPNAAAAAAAAARDDSSLPIAINANTLDVTALDDSFANSLARKTPLRNASTPLVAAARA
tara:strand:- start:123 stop:767 length:645 start_codon:yes stop_codon:yes gene_type:complete